MRTRNKTYHETHVTFFSIYPLLQQFRKCSVNLPFPVHLFQLFPQSEFLSFAIKTFSRLQKPLQSSSFLRTFSLYFQLESFPPFSIFPQFIRYASVSLFILFFPILMAHMHDSNRYWTIDSCLLPHFIKPRILNKVGGTVSSCQTELLRALLPLSPFTFLQGGDVFFKKSGRESNECY